MQNCEYWNAKIDPAVPQQGTLAELPDDADAIGAIQCLLRARGRSAPGRFSGVTRFDVSQIPVQASIDVDALYYVTFIYERSWQHGDAVMIVGPNGLNTRATVSDAYDAVEQWLRIVERIGIAEVRAQKIHPFQGTPLSWYGRAAGNASQSR